MAEVAHSERTARPRALATSSAPIRRVSVFAFWALIALGVGLRFYALDHDLVWHDEVYTQIFVSGYGSADWQARFYGGEVFRAGDVAHFTADALDRSTWDTVRMLALDEPQHPPLYYVLARGWRALFGQSITALRALSGGASLAALALFYWLALELSGRRRVARLATALMAVSPFFVLYAREAREYALFTALFVGASAALLRALRLRSEDAPRGERVRALVLYAGLATLGLYTSLSMSGVLLAHFVVFALAAHRDRRLLPPGAATFVAIGAAFSPWAWAVSRHWEAFRASMAWSSTIRIGRVELAQHLAATLSRPFVDFVAEPHGALSAAAIVAGGAATLVAWAFAARALRGAPRAMILALALVPLGLFFLPDLAFGGIRSLSARYFTPTLVSLVFAAAVCLGLERERGAWRGLATLVILAVASASAVLDARSAVTWNKGISRALPEIARALHEHPDALVVASREQHHPGNLLALAGRLDPRTRLWVAPYAPPMELPETRGRIYLFTLNPLLREAAEQQTGRVARPLVNDLYANLWVLEDPH